MVKLLVSFTRFFSFLFHIDWFKYLLFIVIALDQIFPYSSHVDLLLEGVLRHMDDRLHFFPMLILDQTVTVQCDVSVDGLTGLFIHEYICISGLALQYRVNRSR
jgi:hypothetical protein